MRFFLLIIPTLLLNCTSDFDELDFQKNFKDVNHKFVDKIMLEEEINCSLYFINQDNTFSFRNDCDSLNPKIQLGNWKEKNDTTIFTVNEIQQFNFFLDYKLTGRKNSDYQIIILLDKTNKAIKTIASKLIGKKTTTINSTGKIELKKGEYDSISFPILEKLTQKKHALWLPEEFDTLRIIMDFNSEIIKEIEPKYDFTNEQFHLFTSVSKIFDK